MVYLISQDWINTSNNHAGIKYLCNQLADRYPLCYKSIYFPDYSEGKIRGCKLRNVANVIVQRLQHKQKEKEVLRYLYANIKDGDVVFVMEYMEKSYEMFSFVRILRAKYPNLKIYCMAHLVPAKLNKQFHSNKELLAWCQPIDKLFTLGNSLTLYFQSRGVNPEKIKTTFHYVDDYYFKQGDIYPSDNLTVIAMGNQVRNIALLKQIVDLSPQFHFIICQGMEDMSELFKTNRNVELIPFVSETELINFMEQSDISLNVMEDTIGSNVIVTSLAMGLAMICSDVGSIRDYCNENNTIFCRNDCPRDFAEALHAYTDNELLMKFKSESIKSAHRLTIEKFHLFLQKELNS